VKRAFSLLALGYTLSACSVTALAERERTTAANECTSSSECGGGFCSDGACLSRSTNYSGTNDDSKTRLLFELVPISSATGFGGKPVYLETIVPLSGEFDLDFGGFSQVEVRVIVPDACLGASFVAQENPNGSVRVVDGTVPARITMIPSYGRFGLAADEYHAEVDSRKEETDQDGKIPHRVTFRAAIGSYDMYIEPRALSVSPTNDLLRAACTFPPQLMLQKPIGTSPLATVPIGIPSPAPLAIQVRLPTAYSLVEWKLDVVEPGGGRLISTTQTIRPDAKSPYDIKPPLYFYPVWTYGNPDADQGSTELVRLSPPPGLIAPTYYYQRKAIEIFDRGFAVIEPPPVLPTPVTFEGQILGARDGSPASASVVLTATELTAVGSGVSAVFETRAMTDENGRFSATLLPGKYRVRATPNGGLEDYAAAEATWEVAETPRRQTGRTLELPAPLEITGRAVFSWNASGVFGAAVAAEPSRLDRRPGLLTRALGAASLSPRFAQSSIDDPGGEFGFASDFGKVDFFVRPPDSSHLAWFVMPGLEFASDVESTVRLNAVQLPLPLRLTGDVRILNAPPVKLVTSPASYRPAQSLLRAYVLLDADGQAVTSVSSAQSAVPIAETRIDANDRYTLFLPASLNLPVKAMN
jgi:hypothetical protein